MGFDFSFGLGDLASGVLNYFGGEKNRDSQLQIAQQNIQAQREFAQQGIRWKVADALAAGIHPLAALGAQTTSFSPVSVGDVSGGLGAAGQDIGRAVKAMVTSEERDDAVAHKKAQQLALEKGSLENELLRSQIRRLNAPGTGPGMPGAGKTGQPAIDKTVTLRAPVKADDIKQKAEDFPQTKIGRPFGYPLLHNPYFGDGQSFEDRYGESDIASTAKFGVNTLADHAYTGYKWIAVPTARRVKRFYEKYGPRYIEGR